MKIVGHQTHVVRVTYEETVRGTHVVLRLRTDDGIEGISYVSRIAADSLRLVVLMIESRVQQVIGQDPMATEALYERLFRNASGLELRAASAIDVALWDIRGKALGQPVYKLLGGFRDRVPVSANWGMQFGATAEGLAKARELVGRGFAGLKFQVGALTPDEAVRQFRALRQEIGSDVKLIVDANQRWSFKQALVMGRAIAEYDPYWIEDPLVHWDYAGLRQVREALPCQITCGEVFTTLQQHRWLMEQRSCDIVMIDMDFGLTGFVKVAHLAEAHGLPVHNHLASEILAHAIAAVPNGLILGFYPWAQPLFKEPARIENGEYVLSDKPGLGLELDEDALKRFEFGG
ncbi:MAG TPA: mandelate racemase/muconate lactonizing enzyme family protein [Dehalococcoidia bacterium]|nr:mandelate racemase/muconate lactonizing enzyme family protein [Dehalococcoidia bacterium]